MSSQKLSSSKSEMDACLLKYLEYKEKMDQYEDKLKKYRSNLKTLLKKRGESKYKSEVGSVTLNESKSTLSKKTFQRNISTYGKNIVKIQLMISCLSEVLLPRNKVYD